MANAFLTMAMHERFNPNIYGLNRNMTAKCSPRVGAGNRCHVERVLNETPELNVIVTGAAKRSGDAFKVPNSEIFFMGTLRRIKLNCKLDRFRNKNVCCAYRVYIALTLICSICRSDKASRHLAKQRHWLYATPAGGRGENRSGEHHGDLLRAEYYRTIPGQATTLSGVQWMCVTARHNLPSSPRF